MSAPKQILKKTNLKAFAKAKELGPERVIQLFKDKGLCGRGGANFCTGTKLELVRNAQSENNEKFVICNADEGEPGTFKDRFILTNNPEIVIEGMIISAFVVCAKEAFIYLRGEYEFLESKLKKTVNDIIKRSKADLTITIVLGQGSYVCGEETAILESIEGRRGQPRIRPPYPTTKGLYNKPTALNNVETLANMSLAVHFDDWNQELRLHSLSGSVTNPGVFELPVGTPLKTLIDLGKPKNKIKAVYFGCFGGCLPYDPKIKLGPENICGKDCLLGSHTVIAVDETHSMLDIATVMAKFYEYESCGKCTPCREGTVRMLNILENISLGKAKKEDIATLEDLGEVIEETSSCGLGQTCAQHLLTALKHYRKEFEKPIKKKQ